MPMKEGGRRRLLPLAQSSPALSVKHMMVNGIGLWTTWTLVHLLSSAVEKQTQSQTIRQYE